MRTSTVIMQDGIRCLLENLGAFETECFIANMIKEPADYTQWQKEYFADFPLAELNKAAVAYNQKHPFVRNS